MKSLQSFRESPTVVIEESDYSKFDALVRAGLANKAQMQRIHRILDKMQDEKPQFNNADRAILQNLFNKMVDLITTDKQIFQKAKQSVKEETELEEKVVDAATSDYIIGPSGRKVRAHRFKVGEKINKDKEDSEENIKEATELAGDPPFVLVLKRKAIRYYPNDTKIALYYNDKLDKYFSIPYGPSVNSPIQAEENQLDEKIVKVGDKYRLVSKKTGRNLGTYGTKKQAIKREGQVQFFKHHGEEVEYVEEAVMDQLHKIVSDKQSQKVKFGNGETRTVDHFTASAVTQVHKALNDENKKKFADMVHKSPAHLAKASDFAFKRAK
jgi:hypothetical protein